MVSSGVSTSLRTVLRHAFRIYECVSQSPFCLQLLILFILLQEDLFDVLRGPTSRDCNPTRISVPPPVGVLNCCDNRQTCKPFATPEHAFVAPTPS